MPSLSQSPVLQALGYAIANSLWQMAIVWIVYVLLNSIFKFRSEIKFRIAVAAQVVGFSWFLVTLQFYYRQCSQALEMAESIYLQASDQQTYIVASETGSLLNYFIKAEQLLPYLSVAYLLLLAFLTIRWFRAYQYTQLVRLNGLHKIDVDWKLFVKKVAAQLGIKQKVRIFLSEIAQSPVTIGFLKPVILIPIASINHLSPQQLEAIILHELAHIRRHDYVLNIVLSVIELGLFFNPFTRLITKSISKERENSCDDWVLQYQYNPSMYAEALLRIAVLQKTPSIAMHAVKCKGELLSRVQRMVHQKDDRFNYRHQLVALLLMTGILASIAWFDPSAVRRGDNASLQSSQAVVMEPLAARIDNPLFNPMFLLNNTLKKEVNETMARANEKTASEQKRKTIKPDSREIVLPRVLAPVAIESLHELETRLAVANKDLKKALSHLPAQMKLAQGNVFHFDTIFQKGSAGFSNSLLTMQDFYWPDIDNEMKALQKARRTIEEAATKGTVNKAMARLQLAELSQAMQKLKDLKLPQVYGFAPSTFNNDFVFRSFSESEQQNEKKASDEKRRHHTQFRAADVRIKKASVDSIKQKVLAKTGVGLPHQPSHRLIASVEGSPVLFIDKNALPYLMEKPRVSLRTPVQGMHPADVTGHYVFEYGDECEKANLADRSTKRTKPSATGKGKGKGNVPAPPKTRSRIVKATCTSTTSTITAGQGGEQIMIVEVNVQ